MRKISYIFTAILAIVVSTGAWASTPTEKEAQNGTSHPVYDNAPIEGEATEGIAGVTYVNRVANRAGAAAQAAEDHAAHASKSAYDAATAASNAATAASNAQASADIAAAVINNLQAGDGVTVADVKSADGQSTVGKKVSAKISDGLKFVGSDINKAIAVNPGTGIDVKGGTVNVTPGVGIKINNDAVAVNTGAGLKAANDGAVTINEGVGLKLEGDVLVPNLIGSDSVTITEGTGDDKDKLVISANTPTANTPGVVKMPTYTELQVMMGQEPELPAYGSESEEGRQIGLSVETYMNAEIQHQIDMAEQINAGALSGSYQTYAKATLDGNNTTNATAQSHWKTKPLSAAASYELALLYRDETVSLKKDNNGNTNYNVGNDARPVYVVGGAAAAVKSITIPVDADNFEDATTTAKIWIQK